MGAHGHGHLVPVFWTRPHGLWPQDYGVVSWYWDGMVRERGLDIHWGVMVLFHWVEADQLLDACLPMYIHDEGSAVWFAVGTLVLWLVALGRGWREGEKSEKDLGVHNIHGD